MARIKILFRADGNSQIGFGHVIRSLALADMLNEEFDCIFLIQKPSHYLFNQISEVCSKVYELPDSSDYLTEARYITDKYLQGDEIVVLDGYGFDAAYQKVIKQKGSKLVCIDDLSPLRYCADVILNHAPLVLESDINFTGSPNLLLGASYSILRGEFLHAARIRKTKQFSGGRNTVFVSFGGSDTVGINKRVLAALKRVTEIENVHLIVGKEYINSFDTMQYGFDLKIYAELNAREIIELVDTADFAMVSASTTLFEVIALRCPVIAGYYTDNQKAIYEGFKSLGCLEGAGRIEQIEINDLVLIIRNFTQEAGRVQEQLNMQVKAIDGKSADRIIQALRC